MDKITYGLEEVYVHPIVYDRKTKVYTYGEPIEWPSAVSVTLPKNGSIKKIYADNGIWYTIEANQGYTGGNFVFYSIPEDIETKIMGKLKVNGVIVEDSNTVTKECCVTAKFKGDESDKRIVLYRCKFDRSEVTAKTKEEEIEAQQYTIPVEVMPRENDGIVKASARLLDAPDIYNNWNDTIFEPPVPDIISFKSAVNSDGSAYVMDKTQNTFELKSDKADDKVSVSLGNGNLTAEIKNGESECPGGVITYQSGENNITVTVKHTPTSTENVYTFKVTYTASSS